MQKKSGIPGVIIGFVGFVLTGVLAVFGLVGYTAYQGTKAMNMSEDTVQRLADKIVNPNVTALQLEKEGLYKVNYGGFFLDGCRERVLTDNFNQGLSTAAKADKINNCIKEEIVQTASRNNVTVRRHF